MSVDYESLCAKSSSSSLHYSGWSDDWDIALEVDQYYIVIKISLFFFLIKYQIAIITSIGVIYTNQWWRTTFISGGWSRDWATEPSVGPILVVWTSRDR